LGHWSHCGRNMWILYFISVADWGSRNYQDTETPVFKMAGWLHHIMKTTIGMLSLFLSSNAIKVKTAGRCFCLYHIPTFWFSCKLSTHITESDKFTHPRWQFLFGERQSNRLTSCMLLVQPIPYLFLFSLCNCPRCWEQTLKFITT
jgi:hypothetical protein